MDHIKFPCKLGLLHTWWVSGIVLGVTNQRFYLIYETGIYLRFATFSPLLINNHPNKKNETAKKATVITQK